MERLDRTMSAQTEKLIKGLEYLLQARECIYSAYMDTYGDEQGDRMYSEVYEKDMGSLLVSLKISIGDSIQVNMGNLDTKLY